MAYILDGVTSEIVLFDYTLPEGQSIVFPTLTYEVKERAYIASRGSNDYIRFDTFSGGTQNELEVNIGGTITTMFTNLLVVGRTYQITITRDTDTSYTVSMVEDGNTGSPLVSTATAGGATRLRYDSFGADNSGSQNLQSTATGLMVFGSSSQWDFDSAPVNTNEIEDTISSNNAVFNSGVTFQPPAMPDLSFTNFADNAFIAVNSFTDTTAQFTVSGTVNNGASVPAIEWRRGTGAWQTLISSPANSWTSPQISITGRDSISFRGTHDPATEYTYLNVGAAYVMARVGQSNSSMRGDNNQVYVGDYAYNILANGSYGELADPYSLFSDPSSLGSSMPLLATHMLNSGITPAFVPNGLGGQALAAMMKGQPSYTQLTNSINGLINGTNEIHFIQGKADLGTNPTTYELNLNQLVNDQHSDFGVQTRITLFADISPQGTAIRAAQQNVIDTNPNAIYGGDGLNAMPSGNLHFQTDQELQLLADEIFSTMVSSTINFSLDPSRDGTYRVNLYTTDGGEVFRENVTFVSGVASITVPVLAGVRVEGYMLDNLIPSEDGVPMEYVTT